MITQIKYLPFDILNIILQYDGRIKYLHKKRRYIDVISKYDYRYNIIEKKINNQINLIKSLNIGNNGFNYYIHIYYKNDIFVKGLMFSKKMI
jgi:hypothetical protein